MKKVRTMEEAYRVFEYLGIKEVTKPWQKAKGTEVWELPFKTMYNNGSVETNRFSMYRNCLLYTSPSPRDGLLSRMPSSA